MTRNQRTVHARAFSILTPLLAVLIVLALVRAQHAAERLRAEAPEAPATPRSTP